jgi:hypothetical protein
MLANSFPFPLICPRKGEAQKKEKEKKRKEIKGACWFNRGVAPRIPSALNDWVPYSLRIFSREMPLEARKEIQAETVRQAVRASR